MAWKDLNLQEKAAYISIAILNGLIDRELIEATYNKFEDGGRVPIDKPIENPVIPESQDLETINWMSWWLNNRRKQLNNNMLNQTDYTWYSKPIERVRGDIRKDGFDVSRTSNTIPLTDLIKGYENGRMDTNKEYYRQINNAAVAPEISIGTEGDRLTATKVGAYIEPNNYNNSGHYIAYVGNLPTDIRVHERTHASHASPQEATIAKRFGVPSSRTHKDYKQIPYNQRPTEIYAYLQQYRKKNNLSPLQVIDKDYLDSHRKELNESNLDWMSDNDLMWLFNEIAYNPTTQNSDYSIASNGERLNKFDDGGESSPILLNNIDIYPSLETRALIEMRKRLRSNLPMDNYSKALDMAFWRKCLTKLTDKGVSNCMLNVGSAYGDNYTYARSLNAINSPNFKRVYGEDVVPGTMMIQSLPNMPDDSTNRYHSTIFSGVADKNYTNEFGDNVSVGDSLYIYSNGKNQMKERPKQALMNNNGKTKFRYYRPVVK